MIQASDLPSSWLPFLHAEFKKKYMIDLGDFLAHEKKNGKIIYPKIENIFEAFFLSSFENTKVVIIGQDPYHGEGQAHGISFSVNKGVTLPPSLVNIFKELKSDLGLLPPPHGNLSSWANQGVLLLNSVLTVEKDKAASHQKKGWEFFTDRAIEVLNEKKEHLVFLLWGGHAEKKGLIIDQKRHLVLKAPHPSPLSSYRGFFGCKHFSKTNDYLVAHDFNPIDWKIE